MPNKKQFNDVVAVFGNGKSRKYVNFDAIHEDVITIGCNAFYRDHTPDYLVATDVHITAEIVNSGYTWEHKCYFRDWILHPADMKEMVTFGFEKVTDLHTDQPFFVATGLTDVDSNIEAHGSEVVIFGVNENDLSEDLKAIGCDLATKETMEFVGPNAVDVACHLPFKVDIINLFGFDFDLYSFQGKVNNVYTGTTNYMQTGALENQKMMQSAEELARVVKENPTIKFAWWLPPPAKPKPKLDIDMIPLPLRGLKNFKMSCISSLDDRHRV